MKISAFKHKIYTKQPFVVSYGAYDFREAVTIEIEHEGIKGYGEATVITYYHKTVKDFKKALEKVKPFINSLTTFEPQEIWPQLVKIIPEYPFIQCAIDCALHSIRAEMRHKPLYKQLGFSADNLPETNFTISIGTPEKILQDVANTPWPSYKIKVAEEPNIALLTKISKMHDSTLRLDANTAWPQEKAAQYIDSLEGLPIDFIEQPFKPEESNVLRDIKDDSPFVFMADESCQTLEDVEKCKDNFDGVNIKLQKCGGLTPALEMIKKADKWGLKKMVGCMTESSIGITYAAQILSGIDFADLDGNLLIKDDFADGIKIDYGQISLPNRIGSGISLNNNFKGIRIL